MPISLTPNTELEAPTEEVERVARLYIYLRHVIEAEFSDKASDAYALADLVKIAEASYLKRQESEAS